MFWLIAVLILASGGYLHYRLAKKTFNQIFQKLSEDRQRKKGGEK